MNTTHAVPSSSDGDDAEDDVLLSDRDLDGGLLSAMMNQQCMAPAVAERVVGLSSLCEENVGDMPGGVAAPWPIHVHAIAAATAQPKAVLALDSTKAGMQTVDKATIERIINEASAGSKFYVNEQRKDVARRARLERLTKRLSEFDDGRVDRLPHERRCAEILSRAHHDTELGEFIHFDMDMFYAAVDELLRPELKGVPFGVGGMGMLCTSNYLARAFGVRAGMPGYIAKKLCPQLVFSWSGHDTYSEYSERFKKVVREYDPNFTSMGLDEVTMDAGPFLSRQRRRFCDAAGGSPHTNTDDYVALLEKTPDSIRTRAAVDEGCALPASATESAAMNAEQLAWEIRARVYRDTKLTASAGIAPTAALAKVLSNFEKPDGQSVLKALSVADLREFMSSQPIRRIGGVGRVLDELLQGVGITTCREFYEHRVRLCYAMTPKTFEFLLVAAVGCQPSFGGFGGAHPEEAGEEAPLCLVGEQPVNAVSTGKRKSIGKERTFGQMPSLPAFVEKAQHIFDRAYDAFVEEGVLCKAVGIKLKKRTFDVHQTAVKLESYTADRDVLWSRFEGLLLPVASHYAEYRLLGCRFVDLITPQDLARELAESAAKEPQKVQRRITDFAPKKKRNRAEAVIDCDGERTSASDEDDDVVVVVDVLKCESADVVVVD